MLLSRPALLLAALLLASCSSSVSPLVSPATTQVPALPTVSYDNEGVPSVEMPNQRPPRELTIKVLSQGSGPRVLHLDQVSLHYIGTTWSGHTFVSTYHGDPLSFRAGAYQVVPALDLGLLNLTQGSKVLIIAPPSFGYTTLVAPDKVAATDTLVFVVDLISVS